MKKVDRFRLRFVFWLDMKKPAENELAEQIEQLKATRNFSRAIRDGLRLFIDLKNGSIKVLLELFPFVKDAIEQEIREKLESERDVKLEALVSEFREMMLSGVGRSSFQPALLPNVPIPIEGLQPKVAFNEAEAKERSIKNTLAALDDF